MSIEIKRTFEVVIDGDNAQCGRIYSDNGKVLFSAPVLPMDIEELIAILSAMEAFEAALLPKGN